MIRENNIMNRVVSALLAISMLVTNLFNSAFATAYSETSAYEDNVGCKAIFNTDAYEYFPVSDDPSNLSWDPEYQLMKEDLGEDFKVVITDYYISDNEGDFPCLWYKVEAAPDCEAPEKLIQYPWVFQNYLGENADDYDSLIIEKIEEDSIAVFDEHGNEVGTKIELPQFEKIKLIGASPMVGDVDYQWQILIDDTWIDIYGQNKPEFRLSYGVVGSVLEDFQAKIRLITKESSKVIESDPITATVIPYVEDEPDEEIQEDESPTDYEVHTLSDDEEVSELTVENDDSDYDNNEIENSTKELNEDKPTSESEEASENKENEYEYERVTTPSTDDIDAESDLAETEEIGEKTETNEEEKESVVSPEPASSEEDDENFLNTLLSMFTVTAYAEDGEEENTPEETTETDKVTVTVKYVYGSNNAPVDADTIYQIQKNSTLNQELSLPVMEGYDAYLESDTENICTSYSINLTNVTEDKVITFKYWPAKVNYTVIYYWQNAEDDNYTEYERKTMTGFTGENTTVEEKEYEGFYRLLYEKVPIASDGSTVIEVYYDRLYYKMIFNLDGGYGVQPIYARYGTLITVSNPTKAGYNFVGWDDITKVSEDGIADVMPKEIPSHHSEYKAIWEANDNAKVTIVYWGENANDEEYAYQKSQEIFVTPGTELTFGTNQLVCTLEQHEHSDSCNINCGINEHSHSIDNGCTLSCGHTHTHTQNCYTSVKANNNNVSANDQAAIKEIGDGGPQSGYVYIIKTNKDSRYYMYLYWENSWYRVSQDYSIDYTYIEGEVLGIGTYNTTGYNSTTYTATKYKARASQCTDDHTHNNDCFECDTAVHTHTADCYPCVEHTHSDNCYLKPSNMDSDLWTYVESDTVTVAADGSTVMNVYYDRKEFTLTFNYNYSDRTYSSTEGITAKWGENIATEYKSIADNAGSTFWSATADGEGPYTNYFGVMPTASKTYYHRDANGSSGTMYYYGQDLNGEYTIELFNVPNVGGYTVTDEDRYQFEGFTYHHGTSNQSSCSDAKFYYTRNRYTLEFNNGEESVKTENVLYEYPLSGYNFTPDMPSFYEPGSREFAGWYLNPECTGEEYILSDHTMPADNLLLYAKWIPVTHTVRFYLDKNIDKTDANVYTAVVDEKTIQYKYDVPHGSAVQNPYTPPNDPEKGQYIFVGWFYEDVNGKEQMWDFENTTVTADVDIYAKWSSNSLVQYEVKFVYKDGDKEVEIAEPITGSALGGNSKTFEAKGNDQLYSDYQEGYFPTTQSHTIVMDLDNPDNNTYTFYYTKAETVPYTVYYVTDAPKEGATEEVSLNGKTYYIVADTKMVTDNKKAIVTETYAKVPGYLPDTYQQTLIINPKDDNKIIFYYTKDEINGMYVVHYLTENLDGTYAEHSIFEGRGKIGAEVNATIKNIENFTHDSSVKGTKLSGTISKDTVLELNVYYKRNCYPYKVQYLEKNTNKPLSDVKVVKDALWQSIVTEEAITIENYAIDGNTKKSIQINKDGDTPTVNVITFYYTENKCSLTIRKTGAEAIDEKQSFIFRVKGVTGTNTADIDLRVVIKGSESITINELPIGTYEVIEETAWSWRYTPDAETQEIELKPSEENEVPFKNNRTKKNWLNGAAYRENLFVIKEENEKEAVNEGI